MHDCSHVNKSHVLKQKIIERSGVDPNACHGKFYDYTPLIWAARDGRVELVRELVLRGARVEHSTSGGYTALHKACIEGHNEVLHHFTTITRLKSKVFSLES